MISSRFYRLRHLWNNKFSLDPFDFIDRNIRWIRWVIVFFVYLVTISFGFLAANVNPVYVVVVSSLLGLGLVALVLMQRFDLAPFCILASALFIPFTLPTGTGSRLAFSTLV